MNFFKLIARSKKATIRFSISMAFAVLGILVLFLTVNRWRFESTLREGIVQAFSGQGDPTATLQNASSMRPDDPLPYLYLGFVYFDRASRLIATVKSDEELAPAKGLLEKSAKAFETAHERRSRDPLNESDSALICAAAAKLHAADLAPTERAALIDDAQKTLERVRTQDDADVQIGLASVAMAKGEYANASKILSDVEAKLTSVGRGSASSYYWHRGLLALLGKDPSSVELLRCASLFRRGRDVGAALSIALQLAATDPSIKDPKTAADNLERLAAIVRQHVKKGESRWVFKTNDIVRPNGNTFSIKYDEARIWNALGLGAMKLPPSKETIEKAIDFFHTARVLDPRVEYVVNESLAHLSYKNLPPPPNVPPERWLEQCLGKAAGELAAGLDGIAVAPEQLDLGQRALMFAVGLNYSVKRYSYAKAPLELARKKFNLDEKEYERTVGALLDWSGALDQAVPHYRKAIELRHRDAFKMELRLNIFDAGKQKK